IDAALTDGADMLITMSTPTLQAAAQKVKNIPVVFTYVASAAASGVARTREDHTPNITGVDMLAAYPEMLAAIRQMMPSARRLGTLFVPSEVNMVVNKDGLSRQAAQAGFELVTVPVSTATEVPDAALALMSRKIDALCQITGNLTAASWGGIAPIARKARVPAFTFQRSQADGAVVVMARDFHDAGKAAAGIAARIMHGEDPARIPILDFTKIRMVVNLDAARAVGLRIPPPLIARADEVIGK
ncbi:MAG: ABC transporter substrate-binding protein, partial [Candidatus Rokuibacteriota bacterium]